ncbi:MAG TPA: radical SAM protein [Bryobacteraceae bacterium]|nr:radical SAM protein [Bryobacteraceae bacterium]
MRIALVNPPLARRYTVGLDEPLAIEYLAAQVQDSHDVMLADGMALGLTVEECAQLVVDWEPDLVGISLTFTGAWSTVRQLLETIRALRPSVATVLGGNTATFLAGELAALPSVDYVVKGEGDNTFRELVQALDAGIPPAGVAGLCWTENGTLVDTGVRPLEEDVDRFPLPARNLLPLAEHYRKVILSARGCPYGCIYCSTSAFWQRRFRTRSVDSILAEARTLLSDPALDYFSFADDCFTLSERRVLNICDGLDRMGHALTWSCTGRIETIAEGMLRRMAETGCRHIFFGVESGSDAVLKSIGRKYSAADVVRVYTLCLRHGIQPSFSYIVGLPSEREADRRATLDLIDRLGGVENGMHILTPFPGTPIGDDPDRFGIQVVPHTIEDLDINTRSLVATPHFSPERTEEDFRTGLGVGFRALRRVRSRHEASSRSEA